RIALADRTDVPGTMNAAAVIQADQPIVAIGDLLDTATGIFELYTGVSGGANSQVAPLVFNDRNGWDSEVRVQSTGTNPVSVRVGVQPTGGGTEVTSAPTTLAPNTPYSFRPRDVGVASGFVGSARIEANGPVAAVVSEFNNGRGTGMGYNTFSRAAGTTRIS